MALAVDKVACNMRKTSYECWCCPLRTCFGWGDRSNSNSITGKCTSATDFCAFASALGHNFSPKPKESQTAQGLKVTCLLSRMTVSCSHAWVKGTTKPDCPYMANMVPENRTEVQVRFPMNAWVSRPADLCLWLAAKREKRKH